MYQVLCTIFALAGVVGCVSNPTPHPADPDGTLGVDTRIAGEPSTADPDNGFHDRTDATSGQTGEGDAAPPLTTVDVCDGQRADDAVAADGTSVEADCGPESAPDDNASATVPGGPDIESHTP